MLPQRLADSCLRSWNFKFSMKPALGFSAASLASLQARLNPLIRLSWDKSKTLQFVIGLGMLCIICIALGDRGTSLGSPLLVSSRWIDFDESLTSDHSIPNISDWRMPVSISSSISSRVYLVRGKALTMNSSKLDSSNVDSLRSRFLEPLGSFIFLHGLSTSIPHSLRHCSNTAERRAISRRIVFSAWKTIAPSLFSKTSGVFLETISSPIGATTLSKK